MLSDRDDIWDWPGQALAKGQAHWGGLTHWVKPIGLCPLVLVTILVPDALFRGS